MAPHTPNLAFSFLACACSLRLRQQAAMVAPPRSRSAAGRRLALELLTSSASQPPHSYLKASIGSMRAALFAG